MAAATKATAKKNNTDVSAVSAKVSVTRADVVDFREIATLFDAYRVHFGQKSNLPEAEHFIFDRLSMGDSVIYLAKVDETVVGMMQLYPCFFSLGMHSFWILNDLYVVPEYRQHGVARTMIDEVAAYFRERGDRCLIAETAKSDKVTQDVYKSIGFTDYDALERLVLPL